MSFFKVKSLKFGKNYRYKLLPSGNFNFRCIKIIDIDTQMISFSDNTGNPRFIAAEFIPFWGYDIYAEVLCDFYGGSGLFINNSRSKEYYEEAKGYLQEQDFIKFCNIHKSRWRRLINQNYKVPGFT